MATTIPLRSNWWTLSFCLIFAPLLTAAPVYGQNKHENTWYFGQGHSVNFTTGNPVAGGMPIPMERNQNALRTAVSDQNGTLQFFVTIYTTIGNSKVDYTYLYKKVFDRNGIPFAHGNIQACMDVGGMGHSGQPFVVPYPGQQQKYLLFHVHNNALLYSVVDMTLNGGLGDIDTTQKDIMISPFNTIVGYKMTTIQGCAAVWLVARSAISNEYLSFQIDTQGVHPVPVRSPCGLLEERDYLLTYAPALFGTTVGHAGPPGGVLQSSTTSRYIAAGTLKGIELYDFDPCSGLLKNPRVVDTAGAYGLCFSPDDTKLYASQNYSWPQHGKVFQYDLSLGNPTAVWASKRVIIENPIIIWDNRDLTSGYLGELKLAIDGKIYITNNTKWEEGNLYNPAPYPPSTTLFPHQGLHVIHRPDLPGMACQPELNAVQLDSHPNIHSGVFLPKKITTMPKTLPDTIPGVTNSVVVCFQAAALLTAPDDQSCYTWDDGSSEKERTVNRSGTYWVRYFEGCTVTTDTFLVQFIELPEIPEVVYGCPGGIEFYLPDTSDFGVAYRYSLYQGDSLVASGRMHQPQFQHPDEGSYRLRIQTPEGCDTSIPITLEAYPVPSVTALPADTVVRYGDKIQLEASGGLHYSWWPPGLLEEPHRSATWHQAFQPVTLGVRGSNAYGCWDTAYVQVRIDYTLPDGMPNAFSPNGDGHNDVFRVTGLTFQQVVYFRVFNRWGQEVYAGFNNEAGWDGTYKGLVCDAGTYYYQVELRYPDGRRKVIKGDVALLR